MANVVTRRIFTRNLFRLKNFTHFKPTRCTSIFFFNLNCDNGKLLQSSDQKKSLSLLGHSRIQFYADQHQNKNDKPSLFQRFKQMYKDYWYVLVPVHLVTSAVWFGGFYYMAKSGIDIAALLESWNISERITNPLKDSSMGYIAVAYALYKLSTPARYTVTLGGTTIAINYLKNWGYIKPVPSKERLKELYLNQKDSLSEKFKDTKHIIEDLDKSIKNMKGMGDIKHIKGIREKVKCKKNVVEIKQPEKKPNNKG